MQVVLSGFKSIGSGGFHDTVAEKDSCYSWEAPLILEGSYIYYMLTFMPDPRQLGVTCFHCFMQCINKFCLVLSLMVLTALRLVQV